MTRHAATEQLLKSIALRLSSRDKLRNIQYQVNIWNDRNNKQLLVMQPYIKVYLNNHNRKPSDVKNVVQYVLDTEFSCSYELLQTDDNMVRLLVDDIFLPGRYKYILSFDRRRRIWFRID